MAILSPTNLETADYGTTGWNAIYSSNFQKINDYFNRFNWSIATITYSSSINVNWNTSDVQIVTLSGNATINFSNPRSGGKYVLLIKQDATGGRTVTWGSNIVCNIQPNQTANLITAFFFVYDSTNTKYICAGSSVPSGLTQGSILFAGDRGGVSQNNAYLFWDNTNKRLGIGTAAPTASIHVKSNNTATAPFKVEAMIEGFGSGSMPGWNYRAPIVINNTAGVLTDYQVLITLNTATLITAGKMRSDCGDIRFTDSDGSTLLNYWIEGGVNTISTKIWVKVPSIPANSSKTIFVYYGNPSATSESSGDGTFIFFDDFNGDLSKWVITGGTQNDVIAISDGALRVYQDGSTPAKTARIESPMTLSSYILEYRAKTVSIKSNGYLGIGVMSSNQSGGIEFWAYFFGGGDFKFYKRVSGSWTYLGAAGTWAFNEWDDYKIIKNGATFTFYKNDSQLASYSVNLGTTNSYIILPRHWDENTSDFGDQYYDTFRVRTFVSPEPTTSVGDEEPTLAQLQTVLYIQNQTGNIGIMTTTPHSTFHCQGSLALPTAIITADYTVTSTDSILLGDASARAITITLPTAVGIAGRIYEFVKIDSSTNAVTIDGTGTETINGALTKVLSVQWARCRVISDGSNWVILNE